ncbi:HIT domain-containing protein [Winogradskyella schleiferi]|uniref:HIT domain-containing protein n=1 Tax=Winogradskyella schleiferi TaxID=2686078 RepID=UPI0015BC7CAE|nr:HIT domain-containing protein [Winogradskyella schleiferi]
MKVEDLKKDIEEHCRFCNPPDKSRILFETKNFYVMLSLGPIVEGYLLINSKEHIESCSLLSESLSEEFEFVTLVVKNILIETYGGCIFYEHGRTGSCLTFTDANKHCYHAHMHCVPVNINISESIKGTLLPIICDTWEDFRIKAKEYNEPYLFIEDDGIKKIYFVIKEVRRQYIRYLVSQKIDNKDSWNWVEYQGWDKIESAKIKLLPFFNKILNEFK